MLDELDTMLVRGIFRFIDAASVTQKPIKGKCVFREKIDINGFVFKRQARLVAKGFSQREGIDYKETFASTASVVTVRILLAWAIHNMMKIAQGDVKAAYRTSRRRFTRGKSRA